MIARCAFVPACPDLQPDQEMAAAMTWIAGRCRKVAEEHMALAEKAERLMDNFLGTRRFRTGLRTFARRHRQAAWQHLAMACRVETNLRVGCDDFDLTDVAST
jgi:hypothetical protein